MIKTMLQVDQKKRPKMTDIINWPEVDRRIKLFFAGPEYRLEFARTITANDSRLAEIDKSAKDDESLKLLQDTRQELQD